VLTDSARFDLERRSFGSVLEGIVNQVDQHLFDQNRLHRRGQNILWKTNRKWSVPQQSLQA
jgi:hypothetical protein